MNVWPSGAKLRFSGLSEGFDPSVERVEMERGVPKQRIVNSQVMATISAAVLFRTPADVQAFEDWYFGPLGRIGWFTIAHPRTGLPIKARFVGGQIGALSPQAPGFYLAQRQLTMEYLR